MSKIYFFEEDLQIPNFDSEFFRLWISKIEANEEKIIGNLNFIFKDNSGLRKINVDYLNHDYDTDVITFDYSELPIISGDIFLNIDFIRKSALEFNVSFLDELSRVIIHGVLHLCSYDDHTEDDIKLMRAREDFYLSLQ